jgi:hypothetical protein
MGVLNDFWNTPYKRDYGEYEGELTGNDGNFTVNAGGML